MKSSAIAFALFLAFVSSGVSHAQRMKEIGDYFKKPSKVGLRVTSLIRYNLNSATHGLVGAVIAAGKKAPSKYDKALDAVEPETDPDEKLKEFYTKLYSAKGKQVILVGDSLNSHTLIDYKAADVKGKKYAKKDYTFLKSEYGIDEVLIISVLYGVHSVLSYGVVEQNRSGYIQIISTLIDLSDNSYILQEHSYAREKMKGDWDVPPDYENFKKAILTAIDKGIVKEQEKYK